MLYSDRETEVKQKENLEEGQVRSTWSEDCRSEVGSRSLTLFFTTERVGTINTQRRQNSGRIPPTQRDKKCKDQMKR